MTSSTVKVLVDTSILLCCMEESADLREMVGDYLSCRFELLIPKSVLRELEEMSRNRGRRGVLSRAALQYISNLLSSGDARIVGAEAAGDVDEDVLRLAASSQAYIATADKKLSRRARHEGVKALIYRRSKKALTMLS